MTVRAGNDPEASRSLRVLRDEELEREAWFRLHPEIREYLRNCPYEFSAIDAEGLWKHCVGEFDSIAEFKWQLEQNVNKLRAEEAKIGVGNDLSVLPKFERYIRDDEKIDPNDPDVFSLY